MGENFMDNINWGLVIAVIGVLATLLGAYYTKKSLEKESGETISTVNLKNDAQVGNLKVDNSTSNFYGDTKIIKDNIFELNNEQSNQVTKDVLTIRLKSYFSKLDAFENGNLTLSELKPIEYSENDIIKALKGTDDDLVIEVIGFVNNTQRLPVLFEDKRNFFIEKNFKENTVIQHVQLHPIEKNIERTLASLRDKKRRKIIKKLESSS